MSSDNAKKKKAKGKGKHGKPIQSIYDIDIPADEVPKKDKTEKKKNTEPKQPKAPKEPKEPKDKSGQTLASACELVCGQSSKFHSFFQLCSYLFHFNLSILIWFLSIMINLIIQLDADVLHAELNSVEMQYPKPRFSFFLLFVSSSLGPFDYKYICSTSFGPIAKAH